MKHDRIDAIAPCPRCNGHGIIYCRPGGMRFCPLCHGEGEVPEDTAAAFRCRRIEAWEAAAMAGMDDMAEIAKVSRMLRAFAQGGGGVIAVGGLAALALMGVAALIIGR